MIYLGSLFILILVRYPVAYYQIPMQPLDSDRNILANAIQAGSQPQHAQYPPYPYPPVQFPNPRKPAAYPNAFLPPYSDPYATYPVVITEAFMHQLSVDQAQPNIIETFEIVPPWYHKILIPLCCIGCCLRKTVYFQFNNQARQLILMSQWGYWICCEQTDTIPYADIINIKYSLVSAQPQNKPYFNLFIQTTTGQYQVIWGIGEAEFGVYLRGLMKIMIRCGIRFK